jgi:hypothetical protein
MAIGTDEGNAIIMSVGAAFDTAKIGFAQFVQSAPCTCREIFAF